MSGLSLLNRITGYMGADEHDTLEDFLAAFTVIPLEDTNNEYPSPTPEQWATVIHPQGPWILYASFHSTDCLPDEIRNGETFKVNNLGVNWSINMPSDTTIRQYFEKLYHAPRDGIHDGLQAISRKDYPFYVSEPDISIFKLAWGC